MIKLKNTILDLYHRITGSIAFYPALIGVGMILLAIAVMILEKAGATAWLQAHFDILVTYSEDNARTILSVLIGGIISLTVFSFSMVMILLNQAASYFSPRLLPGLVSNRSHQYVLGMYLGTILYCLIILINIYKPSNDINLPGMAILIAILLGITCLGMFVYFIHNISTSIQASNILYQVFSECRENIEKILSIQKEQPANVDLPKLEFQVHSNTTGYLQGVSAKSLLELAEEEGFQVQLKIELGRFVNKGTIVASTSAQLDEETASKLLSCLQLSNQELVRNNYLLGFKHLTEMAVKAMSPGINDPGTAISAVDFLTELLALRLDMSDVQCLQDEKGEPKVFFTTPAFEEVAYRVSAPIRQYAKHDPMVMERLLELFFFLKSKKGISSKQRQAISREVQALIADAEEGIGNQTDFERLKKRVEELEKE